jgi:hypothetical protein
VGQTNFLRLAPCSVPVMELRTDTPIVKRGTKPAFTLVLRNGSTKPVRLIDVRQSRWQQFHAALKFLRGGKEVDVTAPISDPAAIPKGQDYFSLQPGAEERFKLHYEQDASELRPGSYEAVGVFWNFDNRSCLSNRLQFTVK